MSALSPRAMQRLQAVARELILRGGEASLSTAELDVERRISLIQAKAREVQIAGVTQDEARAAFWEARNYLAVLIREEEVFP